MVDNRRCGFLRRGLAATTPTTGGGLFIPMKSHEEQPRWEFGGTYLSPEVMAMLLVDKSLNKTCLALYLIIQSLDGPQGCWASNEYLGDRLGLKKRMVQNTLATLKRLGLVVETGTNGRKRRLKAIHVQDAGVQRNCTPEVQRNCTPLLIGKKSLSVRTGGPDGFGLEEEVDDENSEFDHATAKRLAEAVYTIPEKVTGPRKRFKPSTWAHHIRLLRTKDGYCEDEISMALDWYTENIGNRFVPEAYSGDSFRKKFHSIFKRAANQAEVEVEVSDRAIKIVQGIGWANKKFPGAVQVVLDRYSAWRAGLRNFAECAERDDLVYAYDTRTRQRLLRLSTVLLERMPSATTFASNWARFTYRRLSSWDEWGGDFIPFLFDANNADFRTEVGKVLGTYVGQDIALKEWDSLNKVLRDEEN